MLSFVAMPEYFLPFLKCNMQSGSDNFKKLYRSIREEQGFYSLFSNSFQEFDEKLEPKRVISALGWESFRNRFASLFVHYAANGSFPIKTQESDIGHIIEFEQKFRRFSVEGHGRLFMLGFYFTFLDFKNRNDKFKNLMKEDALFELILKTKIKELRIDWLIITLVFLLDHHESKVLEERISEPESYLNFYRDMDDQTRRDLVASYLAYAASIKDDFYFLNNVFDE